MHYEYERNINNDKKLLKDNYFASKDVEINKSSKILKKYISISKKNDKSISHIHRWYNRYDQRP